MPELFDAYLVRRRARVFGGFLLLIGLFTRPAASSSAARWPSPIGWPTPPRSPFPAINGGDAAILFCFLFLYFVASGPGSYSVDGAREGRAN